MTTRLQQLWKHDVESNLIHQIDITAPDCICLVNNRGQSVSSSISWEYVRETLNEYSYPKRVIVENKSKEVTTSIVFTLINYFVGKGYRITVARGHGDEQIQFLKEKV